MRVPRTSVRSFTQENRRACLGETPNAVPPRPRPVLLLGCHVEAAFVLLPRSCRSEECQPRGGHQSSPSSPSLSSPQLSFLRTCCHASCLALATLPFHSLLPHCRDGGQVFWAGRAVGAASGFSCSFCQWRIHPAGPSGNSSSVLPWALISSHP